MGRRVRCIRCGPGHGRALAMGIVAEDIARVRETADMVAVVSQYTQIKKSGAQWMCLCPFHGEKTPSMSVNAEKAVYFCFGCEARGDIISFVREIEQLDFVAAVELLAAKSGITLRYDQENESAERKHRKRLYDALESAVEWYHQRLLTAPDAGAARGYLRSRGFSPEEVRSYRLGWAPDGIDELARALGVNDKIFVDSGLGFINRRRRQQDSMSFRNRLLFPIFDERDRAVGFGGRILPGGEGPKYKNSSDNTIYSKSRLLYGLNWARVASVHAGERGDGKRGQLVVCEGYTDVIGFARAGVPNAVATCGTALTEDHVRLLKKFCSQVILAFDADKAGNAAADRFYQWERDHDIDVAVADLPAGIDPGELAEKDPERLQAAVAKPVPFLGFRVNRVLAQSPADTAEARARTAEAAMSVIIEHPNPLVRDPYLQRVADHCRLDVARLRSVMESGAIRPPVIDLRDKPSGGEANRDGAGAAGPGGRSPGGRRRNTAQHEALRLAIQRPEEVAAMLCEELFTSDKAVIAYRALAESATFQEALDGADADTADLLLRLTVEHTDAEPLDTVARLRDELSARAVAELEMSVRQGEDFALVGPQLRSLKNHRENLYDLDDRQEAVDALLQWVTSRTEGDNG